MSAKKSISLFIVFFISFVFNLAYAETLPMPSSQQIFAYSPPEIAITSSGVSQAEPVGVGIVANGGDTVSINVALAQVNGNVDVYFAISAPAITSEIYILSSNYELLPFSQAGFIPWKQNITGPVNEKLFGDLPVSGLPLATYVLYLAIAPSGNTDNWFLWTTGFDVNSFTLTVEKFGEGLVIEKDRINCSNDIDDCSESYHQGEKIVLTAIETENDYKFVSWEGCDNSMPGMPYNGCIVEMNKDRTVFPTFAREVVLTKTPVVLDTQYLLDIYMAESGETNFFFSPLATDILNLKSGDIISVSRDDFGYVGMVSSVPKLENGQIVVETVEPETNETNGFVQDGTMVFSESLTQADLLSVEGMPEGVSLLKAESADSTEFTLEFDSVDYAAIEGMGGSWDYSAGSVTLNGSITFEFKPFFGVDIGWFKIKRFKLGLKLTNENNLDVTVKGGGAFQIEYPVAKLTWKFKPKPVCCAVAPVVWIRPVFEVSIGAEGSAEARLTTGAYIKNQLTVGFGYNYRKSPRYYPIWEPVQETAYKKPTLAGKASLKGFVKPQFMIYINEVVRPYFYLKPYLEAKVNALLSSHQWAWGVYYGLDAGIGGKFKIFKYVLANVEIPIKGPRGTIKEGLEEMYDDTEPPSVPLDIRPQYAFNEGIIVYWNESTDNVAVKGYKVYRDGVYVASVDWPSYFDEDVNHNTRYCYRISAYDTAENESLMSTEGCETYL